MFKIGDTISYKDMCVEENTGSLQRGMNYRLGGTYSVVLMSERVKAPYTDRVDEIDQMLIYEGHDVSKTADNPTPKLVDQPRTSLTGKLTQNGLFFQAVELEKENQREPELVRVYEKIRKGIWTYNGLFQLVDAWLEETSTNSDRSNVRNVFKFKLELLEEENADSSPTQD
jgi:hypothetical protein